MAEAETAQVEATCSNCECYKRRHADAEQHARAEAIGHPVSPGLCWRYPTPVPRQPQEGCGEHSELAKRRLKYLARLIAENGMD